MPRGTYESSRFAKEERGPVGRDRAEGGEQRAADRSLPPGGRREGEGGESAHEVQKCHRMIFRPARMWDRSRAGARVRERRGRGRGARTLALRSNHVLGVSRRGEITIRCPADIPQALRERNGPPRRGAAMTVQRRRGPREKRLVSRTVDLTVRWPAPPPPHTVRSWSRGESRRPICFVTANARASSFSRLLVLLRVCPSRRFLRGLRPQCSSTVFRTALLEERPTVRIRSARACARTLGVSLTH